MSRKRDEVLELCETGKGRRKTLSRRAMLRGVGGAAITLPLLEIMWDDKEVRAQGTPQRYGVFFMGQAIGGDGDPTDNFYVPDNLGANYDLKEVLTPLAANNTQQYITVVSGLEIPYAPNSNPSNAPPGGRVADFHISSLSPLHSGMRSDDGHDIRGVTSDHLVSDVIGTDTIFKNLVYTIQAAWYLSVSAPYGRDIMSVKSDANGLIEVPGTVSPKLAFDSLFFNFAPPDDPVAAAEQDFLWRRRKSIIDVVKTRADLLVKKLGGQDRIRLQRHLDEIAELEKRVSAIPPEPGGQCVAPSDPGGDPTLGGNQPDGSYNQNSGYSDEEERARVMMDMIHMAFTCNLTKVAAVLMTHAQSHMNAFQLTGLPLDFHELSHSQQGPMGRTWQVGQGNKWHVKHFAYLVDKLANTAEGTGSVLDNTALLLVNEGGHGYDALDNSFDSAHSTENMACLIAGGAGGLKMGEHIVAPPGQNHPGNVILSAMNAVGVSTNTFGEVTSGPIAELFS
jgi:hypothetical protein